MKQPVTHSEYLDYLTKRSALGLLYRKSLLYPKIVKEIQGHSLDVGCGIGDFLRFRTNTVGVDVNPGLVEYCKSQGLNATLMLPDQLPFASDVFDSVVLDNVLEHISNPKPLLSEINRVLKPLGRLVIGVPGIKGYKRDSDHKVYYSESDLQTCLLENGWKMKKSFAQPFKSDWLSRNTSHYYIYGVFIK